MGPDIVLVVPAFLEDDGNHGPEEQGVGPRAEGQMNIGDPGGFREAGINHYYKLIRVFGHLPELNWRAWGV